MYPRESWGFHKPRRGHTQIQSRLECSGGCLSPRFPTRKDYICEGALEAVTVATLRVQMALELNCMLGGSMEKLLEGAVE